MASALKAELDTPAASIATNKLKRLVTRVDWCFDFMTGFPFKFLLTEVEAIADRIG
jgi:hypothetical protein